MPELPAFTCGWMSYQSWPDVHSGPMVAPTLMLHAERLSLDLESSKMPLCALRNISITQFVLELNQVGFKLCWV